MGTDQGARIAEIADVVEDGAPNRPRARVVVREVGDAGVIDGVALFYAVRLGALADEGDRAAAFEATVRAVAGDDDAVAERAAKRRSRRN